MPRSSTGNMTRGKRFRRLCVKSWSRDDSASSLSYVKAPWHIGLCSVRGNATAPVTSLPRHRAASRRDPGALGRDPSHPDDVLEAWEVNGGQGAVLGGALAQSVVEQGHGAIHRMAKDYLPSRRREAPAARTRIRLQN